ncbi:Eaa1 [Klebsiella pneumoniae]|uniref:DUF551 domain-containing protein n=1 Tax=Klebsiella pneumoniae TaxID=573 RepID=UPI000E2E318F|nr:DUF551 domain-containing protein [Klebsiella pneumoniae]SVO13674.1 Eaa1 [Klebsiella pneumoniae]
MNISTVNELIASLESAGELSIREQKFLKLAKAFKQPASVVPDGYVMVPKEPTEEMLQASYREASVYSPTAYRAMIAAAPQSPGIEPATVPGKWIPVSEQMPEKNQNVLISVNFDSDLVEPLICSARYTGSTFRRGDVTVKPGAGIEEATHWMPLPAAPQEVKGE